MNNTAYAGRRYDVLALRGTKAVGVYQPVQTLFDAVKPGEICVGIQKLAQRWVIEFLTERGSMPYAPTRGCEFLTKFYRGALRTEDAVGVAFRFADQLLYTNLSTEEDATWPDDERFQGANLDEINIMADTLQLHVTVVSRAGTSRRVILPIDHLPI